MAEDPKRIKMDQTQDPNFVDADAPGEHATTQLSQGLLSASYPSAGQGFSYGATGSSTRRSRKTAGAARTFTADERTKG